MASLSGVRGVGCVLIATIALPLVCLGAAGDIDPDFGDGGVVVTNVFPGSSTAAAIAVQPDGRIVVAGDGYHGTSHDDVLVLRYHSDGSLDASFGDGGIVRTPGGHFEKTRALALQGDGKLLVVGSSNIGEFRVARYESDGSPDLAFGVDGVVSTGIGPSPGDLQDGAEAVALQPDGKIVVAGSTYVGNFRDFAIVRYQTDGSLDGTFGTGGIALLDWAGGHDEATGVAVQPDGRIVAGGTACATDVECDFAVARFDATGVLDPSFGSGGMVAFDVGDSEDRVAALLLQADGGIVVGGSSDDGTGSVFAIARLLADGTADPAFPVAMTSFPPPGAALNALAEGPAGTLVAVGTAGAPGAVAVARYLADGSTDAGFGTAGIALLVAGADDRGRAVIVAGDGSILAAGSAGNDLRRDLTVLRIDATGAFDTAFGDGGVVLTSTGYSWDEARGMTKDANGRLLVTGLTKTETDATAMLLLRYLPDGTLDPAFGDGGAAAFVPGGRFSAGEAVLTTPGGQILVAGGSVVADFTWSFTLIRFDADGVVDPTFGDDGVVLTAIGAGIDNAEDILLQVDGKIVLAGFARQASGSPAAFALARYLQDGTLDPSFGSGGITTTPAAQGDLHAIDLQSDGKIVAFGWSFTSGRISATVLRYSTDGALDTSFGTGGLAIVPIGSFNQVEDGLVLADDGIVAVGRARVPNDDFAVFKLLPDGGLDPSFGTGGIATTAVGTQNDTAFAVAVQTDGKLVVAGRSSESFAMNFALARYESNGGLDPTFGSGGILTTPISPSTDEAHAVILQDDGKVVAAGNASFGSDPEIALARYLGDPECGNGFVEPGESCDDGNATDDDCCSNACVPAAQGTACSADADACTVDRCDGSGSCVATAQPDTSCLEGFAKATLTIIERTAGREKLVLKLRSGPERTQSDFGNPLEPGGTDYAVCVFDGAGSAVGSLGVARAGDSCGSRSCWSAVGKDPPDGRGYRYRDRDLEADGVRTLDLKGGAAGRTSLTLKAKNRDSTMPTGWTAALQGEASVTLQVHGSGGVQCLSATLDDVRRADASVFRAR
jgi:uncharacterized delta-60 repeat protein